MTDQEALERWMITHDIHYWFTDAARKSVLDTSGLRPWPHEECMRRLHELRKECEDLRSMAPVEAFFSNLCQYLKQKPGAPAPAALAEENAIRIYKLWFAQFDSWYETFKQQLEDKNNEYAF
jgi:hypothetical protein